MMLFASCGSWGEVQPLLALAKHFKGSFACDDRWLGYARGYVSGSEWLCPSYDHDHTIGGFLEAIDMEQIFESLLAMSARYNVEAIVTPFYLFPAKIVAELHGIPWISTTTSPIYFREIGAVSNERLMRIEAKLNAIRTNVELSRSDTTLIPERTVGLFPSFLGQSHFPVIGYPRLQPLKPVLSVSPMYPYCVISQGSIAGHVAMEDSLDACKEMHLSAVYLGCGFTESARCFGLPFAPQLDHVALLRGANAAIIHGGVGTLCDAIEAQVPVIVRPLYFDNFHNAGELKRHGASLWPSLMPGRIDLKIDPNSTIFERFEEFASLEQVIA